MLQVHMMSECDEDIYCKVCDMSNHNKAICWKKGKANGARSKLKDRSKGDNNKSGKKKKHVRQVTAT